MKVGAKPGQFNITVENIEIAVQKKRIKNFYIRVYPPAGEVRMSVPLKCTKDDIVSFASSKLAWIKGVQAKAAAREPLPEKKYISGETHYFLGQPYLLNILAGSGVSKVALDKNSRHLNLYIKENSGQNEILSALNKWYRSELAKALAPLIAKWEKIIGVRVNDWRVRIMRTRWGTCNITKRRIWLNLSLAQKEARLLEYVVVHELTHLLSKYHDKKFYALMDRYLPEWRALRKELNS